MQNILKMLGVSHTTGHFVTKLSPNIVNKKLLFFRDVYSHNYVLVLYSSKCRLFHNATLFGFCSTHILNTGCAKI